MTVNLCFFSYFNAVPRNFDPRQFLTIFNVRQFGIITKESELEREEIFRSDVFVAVAVLVAKSL